MKVLIVKASSLGDIVQSFGVVDYLKSRFPEGEIDWVVESRFAEMVRAHPHVNRVVTFDSKGWRQAPLGRESWRQMGLFRRSLRQKRYDLLFDLQGNIKSGLVTGLARAKVKVGFGSKRVAEWPNLLFTHRTFNPPPEGNIREDYLALVQGHFGDGASYQPKPVSLSLDLLQEQKLATLFAEDVHPTLVCPSSAWPNKCLNEGMLIEVLHKINRSPYWFVWGSPAERALCLRLSSHFAGSSVLEKLPLPLLQHVMARCQLVVAMDSLPLHLCGTTATPSLSFFGPSLATKYAPQGSQHHVFQGECPYGEVFEKRCPKLRTCPTGACLKSSENEGKVEVFLDDFDRLLHL